ncbi:Acyl-coenzyme A dehydrogenase [Photobacterium damselae subsp. piscicida]|uniref:Acyl-coenzyme A dehydrogenase n=2 Tax=Photobacterium damselae TaxID=38293 RepID=A0A1V1VAX8_PHODP|nr:acyl-CoA dehydrogenase [Photobacterium damselae]MBE8129489.1 acyl-CoA dehydrogenase [Photobacterium damselae subsp. piscicida]PSV74302.1 acyl-CoA dehydrogenase [Photobacterium damselae]PSW77825.1 acyl-CoA dehydrogenase [Photobacterium damselae]QOD55516.1 acyl-CoA dehydrogenase [Photobacterium damselae subsp. piscicida]BAX52695.1 Acyl-coenzyme A dehydrogenase [Photobacterium damselae subsp. piscicida]
MSTLSKWRQRYISDPAFKTFKKVLPPLSDTEKEAMEAGSVWWDGELFSGSPNWDTLLDYPKPELSSDEQAFIDNQLETLLDMLDDYQIVQHDKDLPAEVWNFLRKEKFFSLIISKKYGGLDFSAYANSTIVTKIAIRSLSAAVSVMVPNSLGPGELLSHYGTTEQKDYWLPRLAHGDEIPCFALTGPEAGSDAGSIPDRGEVCYGDFNGKQVLGIKLSWNKRYITLAPVATVLGLAFKLFDPDNLIGDQEELGITCALIPVDHDGVEIGERHNPLGMAFMNGPTRGNDVFIPMDWLIGGQEYAGKGWRMLVECLSAGRGISLPALGTAIGHLTARTTGAYSYVRKQFGTSIGNFEGVAQAMGRIGGLTYLLESARTLTTTALDSGQKPGIVTAIAKYHMTELARVILNDSMDIHAGRAIQLGPMNYIGHHYFGIPVAITVEGANILTRNLMIFGQGATRCHPYVLQEMDAAANPDDKAGAKEFDHLLSSHIGFAVKNVAKSLLNAFSRSRFNSAPVSGETAAYYRQLARMSKALAVSADFAMLSLGGELKRRELVSARLGDVLSHLYLASAVLKRYEDEGRQKEDLPFVHYGVTYCLHQCGVAFDQAFANFPVKGVGGLLRTLTFPLGIHYAAPKDELSIEIAKLLMKPGAHRERLTHLCYIGQKEDDAVGLLERAFVALYEVKGIEKKLAKAIRSGAIPRKASLSDKLQIALDEGIITEQERDKIDNAEQLRKKAIQVDHFHPAEFKSGGLQPGRAA